MLGKLTGKFYKKHKREYKHLKQEEQRKTRQYLGIFGVKHYFKLR